MPIQTRSAAKVRATLQQYFSKKAGQMPTKTEWLNVLNSFINIPDDMNLEPEDIQGLKELLDAKLNADDLPEFPHIPTADEIFAELKTNLEALIDERTADIAAAARKPYIPQLSDMLTDTEPIGTYAQYVGEEDETNRLFPGYFYKKVKEHDPEGEPTTGTQDGEPVTIRNVSRYTLDGETYISNYTKSDNNDTQTQIVIVNNRFVVFTVAKDAVTNPHDNYANILDFSEVFPVAFDLQTQMLATVGHEEIPNSGGLLAITINGISKTAARNQAARARYVVRESDGAAFVFFEYDATNGRFQMLIPRYSDGLYDVEADEEMYYFGNTAADGVDQMNENYTVTPKLPIRSGEGYNTDPAWKLIQVSPFILDE